MNWEKSKFSNVMWFLYVLMTGWALFRMAQMSVSSIPEESKYGGVLLAMEIALVTGGVVFLIYRFRSRHFAAGGEGLNFSIAGQAIITALIFGTGIVFRVTRLSAAGDAASYFELAKVVQGQSAPRIVHGASHIYVQLLHTVFVFVGNKFMAGIWLQIILQCGAALLMYFAVRKLTDALAATISFAYIMFSNYMIQEALELSPRMLYFMLFALGLFVISLEKWEELKPLPFLGKGLLIGILGFLDAGGFLLWFFLAAMMRADWEEEPDTKQKVTALGIGAAGTAAGFAAMVVADFLISGVSVPRILDVWKALYNSNRFGVLTNPSWAGFNLVNIILLITLTIGIFSYWCDRESERLSVWILACCGIWIAGVFGVFTDKIPGDLYLYLFIIVLAGIGVAECFRKNREMDFKAKAARKTENAEPVQMPAEAQPQRASVHGADEIWDPAPRAKSADAGAAASLTNDRVPEAGREATGNVSKAESEAFRAVPETQSEAKRSVSKVESEPFKNVSEVESEPPRIAPEVGSAPARTAPERQSAPVMTASAQEEDDEEEVWDNPVPAAQEQRRPPAESAKESRAQDEPAPEKKREVRYIENPLPLPKPHQKRNMDYDRELTKENDDFDHPVRLDDDFDIK